MISDVEGANLEYDNKIARNELTSAEEMEIYGHTEKALQEILDGGDYDDEIMEIVCVCLLEAPQLISPNIKYMLSEQIQEKAEELWRDERDN